MKAGLTWIAANAVALFVLVGSSTQSTSIAAASPLRPNIETSDVKRFYRIYDAAHGHPTAKALQRDYIDVGSAGLHHLSTIRNVTGESIARALEAQPAIFSDAKRCMTVLPSVRERTSIALGKLRQLYPGIKFPPVTIAVSRGKPVGVADSTGVMIGLEALCAVKYLGPDPEQRFVHTIAHEYTHVLQALKSPKLYNDQNPTVLQSSLIEGAADFVGALISSEVAFRSPYAPADPGLDKEVEMRFLADENTTNLTQWIDNGTLTEPRNLGYWVGYRIVKSYYEHSPDKRKALREIIEMKDPKAFLASSGWHPGIHLR